MLQKQDFSAPCPTCGEETEWTACLDGGMDTATMLTGVVQRMRPQRLTYEIDCACDAA